MRKGEGKGRGRGGEEEEKRNRICTGALAKFYFTGYRLRK